MIPNIKYEYLLVAIAILWALFFSFVLQFPPGFSQTGDDGSYLFAAGELYLNGRLNDGRPLLVAAIHGFPMAFGFGYDAVIVWSNGVNVCCWILAVVLVFKIMALQTSRKAAFIGAMVFLLCIGNLANAFTVLAEPLFIVILLLSVFFLGKYTTPGPGKYLTLAFSVLVLAVLVKPVAMGLTIILAVFYIKKIKDIVSNSYVVLFVGALSLLLFQVVGMKKQYGDYTVSYISSIAYYNYLGGKADCLKQGIPFVPGENLRGNYFKQFAVHQQKEIAKADLKEQLQHNTANLAKAYVYCLYSNSSKGSYLVSETKNHAQTAYFDFFRFLFKAVSKMQNIFFTVVGVLLSGFQLFRKKTMLFHKIMAAFVLYVFFVSGMSCWQCDRFHIVFFPLVIVLLGTFIAKNAFFSGFRFKN